MTVGVTDAKAARKRYTFTLGEIRFCLFIRLKFVRFFRGDIPCTVGAERNDRDLFCFEKYSKKRII
jgi:hypothetical protein